MEADFSGYATKAGLKCTDGRTIMPDAFKHQDEQRVPLVWQHGHSDPENVLGHAILENRSDGVYAYGFFNESGKAAHARGLVEHEDITMMSIWANDLIERAGRVLHGAIREVSLVLSGANPGALIEKVSIRHSDGDEHELDDEAIIYTGLTLEHGSSSSDDDDEDEDKEIQHEDADEKTIADVYNSMTEEQKTVVHFMVGEAIASKGDSEEEMEQDNLDKDGEEETMKHNVFEDREGDEQEEAVLSHAAVQEITADAARTGSLKAAVENYALAHGITDIDILFPDATAITNTPEFFARRTEWVNGVLGGARKTPFSRIKSHSADLTFDEARAKGYVTGALKKEEFFGVTKRVTTPTTIYKKQKLDRDDIIDITDFDVVSWMKGEMRLMLDEEIGRAVLIGDGRDGGDEDKIPELNIRPIATDHDLYTVQVYVNIDDASSSYQEVIDAIVKNRQYYRGSGMPNLYTTESVIAQFLLMKDSLGRRLYKSLSEVASELRVSSIVPVEVLESEADIIGIIYNPSDYVIGADRGGQVTMFDDFDIDYNQYKYLIETRMSGCLTRLKSAMCIRKVAAADVLVVPNAPTFVGAGTNEVTVVDTVGVIYTDEGGTPINAAGSPYAVVDGTPYVVNAAPDTNYYFESSEVDQWTFTYEA